MTRLPRRHALLALVPVLALAAALAPLLLDDAPPPAAAVPAAAPAGPPDVAGDPRRTPEERVAALRALVTGASDPAPVLALLDRLDATEPAHAQVRAMALTALARWPEDARARARLLRTVEASAPRDERLVALGVLASLPGEWPEDLRRRLAQDPDPAVRDGVSSAGRPAPRGTDRR